MVINEETNWSLSRENIFLMLDIKGTVPTVRLVKSGMLERKKLGKNRFQFFCCIFDF
jgi:hypothetical protein